MDKYLHWYEAFWGKAQKQIHEGLGPKWTISYHCGDMWCPESLQDQGDRFTPNLEHLAGRILGIEKILQQVDLLPHAGDAEKLEQATVL